MAKLNLIRVPMGSVENDDTGDCADVIVKSTLPTSITEAIIGGLMILSGVGYLTVKAFINGSKSHCKAHLDAESRIGVLKNITTD